MRIRSTHRQDRSAFATAAVFILLVAASAVMLTTTGTFRNLHRELRFVEKKQVQRWEAWSAKSVELPVASRKRALTLEATNSTPAIVQP